MKTNQNNSDVISTDSLTTNEVKTISTDEYLGVWTNDHYPIVEISKDSMGGLMVSEYYGIDPKENTGSQYMVKYEDNKLKAIADKKLFYKYELPIFSILPNGNLSFICGTGPYELKKTKEPMPNVQYKTIAD